MLNNPAVSKDNPSNKPVLLLLLDTSTIFFLIFSKLFFRFDVSELDFMANSASVSASAPVSAPASTPEPVITEAPKEEKASEPASISIPSVEPSIKEEVTPDINNTNDTVVELPTVPKIEEPKEEKFDDSFVVTAPEEKPTMIQTTPDGGISEIADVKIDSQGMLQQPERPEPPKTDVGEPLLEIVDEDDAPTGADFE